jgi:hypothetical protein
MTDVLSKISSLKFDLDGYRPFSEHVVKQLRDYYRIGLTYTSNAIEGNTLTESETKVIIEDGIRREAIISTYCQNYYKSIIIKH